MKTKKFILLVVIIILSSLSVPVASCLENKITHKTKHNDLAKYLISSSKQLYQKEKIIIDTISKKNRNVYDQKLYDIDRMLMKDVFALLRLAIMLDRLNVEVYYVLGEIYYDMALINGELNIEAVKLSYNNLSFVIDKCSKQTDSNGCREVDFGRAEEMHAEIKSMIPCLIMFE